MRGHDFQGDRPRFYYKQLRVSRWQVKILLWMATTPRVGLKLLVATLCNKPLSPTLVRETNQWTKIISFIFLTNDFYFFVGSRVSSIFIYIPSFFIILIFFPIPFSFCLFSFFIFIWLLSLDWNFMEFSAHQVRLVPIILFHLQSGQFRGVSVSRFGTRKHIQSLAKHMGWSVFEKVEKGFQLSAIFANWSVLDVWWSYGII